MANVCQLCSFLDHRQRTFCVESNCLIICMAKSVIYRSFYKWRAEDKEIIIFLKKKHRNLSLSKNIISFFILSLPRSVFSLLSTYGYNDNSMILKMYKLIVHNFSFNSLQFIYFFSKSRMCVRVRNRLVKVFFPLISRWFSYKKKLMYKKIIKNKNARQVKTIQMA